MKKYCGGAAELTVAAIHRKMVMSNSTVLNRRHCQKAAILGTLKPKITALFPNGGRSSPILGQPELARCQ